MRSVNRFTSRPRAPFLLAFVLLATTLGLDAQSREPESDSDGLAGLRSVVISAYSVSDLPDDVNAALKKKLQDRLTSRVRDAGLKVLDRPDEQSYSGMLVLVLQAPGELNERSALSLRLELLQPARLERNDAPVMAVTWKKGLMGPVEISHLQETAMGALDQLIDKFLAGYHKWNPRKE